MNDLIFFNSDDATKEMNKNEIDKINDFKEKLMKNEKIKKIYDSLEKEVSPQKNNSEKIEDSQGDNEIQFSNLLPVVDKCIPIYKKALDYAIKDDVEILNIAISGQYSSGKSSVWESYINEKESVDKEKVMKLVIGDYLLKNNKNNLEDLEKYIFNQLLFSVSMNDKVLNNSKFSPKDDWEPNKYIKYLIFAILLILFGLVLKINKFYESDFLDNYSIFIKYTSIISVSAGILFCFLNIRKLYLQHFFNINKIKYKDLELDTKMSKNEDCKNEDCKRKGIKFIYMIKDDIFTEEDKAKFFDFILPVVPIMSQQNIANKIKSELNEAMSLNNFFIEDISIFIKDIRVLINIINEYKVYYSIKKENMLTTNDNEKLFSLLTLKNICVKEFVKLSKREGLIYNFITAKTDEENIENYFERDEYEYVKTYNDNQKNIIKYLVGYNYIDESYEYYLNSCDSTADILYWNNILVDGNYSDRFNLEINNIETICHKIDIRMNLKSYSNHQKIACYFNVYMLKRFIEEKKYREVIDISDFALTINNEYSIDSFCETIFKVLSSTSTSISSSPSSLSLIDEYIKILKTLTYTKRKRKYESIISKLENMKK